MEHPVHEGCKTTEHTIIIEHVHPLSEKIAVLENTMIHNSKMAEEKFSVVEERVCRMEKVLGKLTIAVDENHDLIKQIWWLLVGGGIVVTAIFAMIKFILPLFSL